LYKQDFHSLLERTSNRRKFQCNQIKNAAHPATQTFNETKSVSAVILNSKNVFKHPVISHGLGTLGCLPLFCSKLDLQRTNKK
jgi:hypothetical protein